MSYFSNIVSRLLKRIFSNTDRESEKKELVYQIEHLKEKLQKTLYELSNYKHALDESALVSISDAVGIVTHVNKSFSKRLQYRPEEIIGLNQMNFPASPNDPNFLKSIQEKVITGNVWKGELQQTTKDGELFWVNATVVPFMNDDGTPHQYIVIRFEITEQKKAAKALLELNNQLESIVDKRTAEMNEANKALEAFSYSVSHDLRAPLRIINGYADLLIEEHETQLTEEGIRLLHTIMKNTRKMGTLIDGLLNLSRLGRKELSVSKINMDKLVEMVVREQLVHSSSEADIQTAQLLPATGDADLLEHVWSNLVSNAIKYSSKTAKPLIEISSSKVNDKIVYAIKDNGVGFDMKYAPKLFGVFQRLHKISDYEGTGIGLALVQRIITKNRGEVWAESEVDKGTTFYFSLPS